MKMVLAKQQQTLIIANDWSPKTMLRYYTAISCFIAFTSAAASGQDYGELNYSVPDDRVHSPASPSSNPAQWVRPEDYPDWATRYGTEGIVRVRIAIDDEGRPRRCSIIGSSGVPDLDEVACTKVLERARFVPAVTEDGVATASTWSTSIRFTLPEVKNSRALPQIGRITSTIIVEADGTVSDCVSESSIGAMAVDTMCANVPAFQAPTNANGDPVRRRYKMMIEVTAEDIAE